VESEREEGKMKEMPFQMVGAANLKGDVGHYYVEHNLVHVEH